jgi:hypothetical protein
VKTLVGACVVALLVALIPAAANAAPINVFCNGGACSSGWYKSSVALTFTWDQTGYIPPASSDCLGATISTDGVHNYTCTVNYSCCGAVSAPATVNYDATHRRSRAQC